MNFAWLVSKGNDVCKGMRYKNGLESMRKCYRSLALKLEKLKKMTTRTLIGFYLVLSLFEVFCQ